MTPGAGIEPGSHWFLRRGENRSTRRKTSRSRVENQQTQSTYDAGCGTPWDTLVEGERDHYCANPAPLSPRLPTSYFVGTSGNLIPTDIHTQTRETGVVVRKLRHSLVSVHHVLQSSRLPTSYFVGTSDNFRDLYISLTCGFPLLTWLNDQSSVYLVAGTATFPDIIQISLKTCETIDYLTIYWRSLKYI